MAARIATLAKGANQHAQTCAPSQEEAADLVNVSRRSVQSARKVLDHGVPELVAAVERGDIAVSVAGDLAGLPAAEQRKAATGGRYTAQSRVMEIRHERAAAREERREAKARESAEKLVHIDAGQQRESRHTEVFFDDLRQAALESEGLPSVIAALDSDRRRELIAQTVAFLCRKARAFGSTTT